MHAWKACALSSVIFLRRILLSSKSRSTRKANSMKMVKLKSTLAHFLFFCSYIKFLPSIKLCEEYFDHLWWSTSEFPTVSIPQTNPFVNTCIIGMVRFIPCSFSFCSVDIPQSRRHDLSHTVPRSIVPTVESFLFVIWPLRDERRLRVRR